MMKVICRSPEGFANWQRKIACLLILVAVGNVFFLKQVLNNFLTIFDVLYIVKYLFKQFWNNS